MTANRELAGVWLSAAQRPQVCAGLEAVYQMVTDAVAARGPACWASGRCCNFKAAGHRLYVTGLEAAYHVWKLGAAPTEEGVLRAMDRGDCVYLAANLCTAHAVKPLGCRVYFCDRSAQEWQEDLSERGLKMIKELHDRHGIEYRYGEWNQMLLAFASGS